MKRSCAVEPSPSKQSKPPSNEFSKSGLVHSLHGDIYQLKLIMMFLQRGLLNGYRFELATERDDAEKFDDVVFEFSKRKSYGSPLNIGRFLQAKHKLDDNKTITVNDLITQANGEFSLKKYFDSYCKIRRSHIFESDLCKRDFVLCTNIGFKYGDSKDGVTLSQDIFDQVVDEHGIFDTTLLRFKKDFEGKKQITSAIMNASEVIRLVKKFAEIVLDGVSLADDKTKDDPDAALFKAYQFALIDEVIDGKTDMLSSDFIRGQNLSIKAMLFRTTFIKLVNDRRNSYNIEENPIICDQNKRAFVQLFTKELAQLIKSQKGKKVIKVMRWKSIIKENIDKLAGHVLVKIGDKVKFSQQFLLGKNLPGNLNDFRAELLKDFTTNNLSQYEFECNNLKVCEELYVREDSFWEFIRDKKLEVGNSFGKCDHTINSLEKFVEKISSLIVDTEASEKRNVHVKRSDKVISSNIDKLAKYVLIEDGSTFKFSSDFLDGDVKLPGNLDVFRRRLFGDLEALSFDCKTLGEYKFLIRNFPKSNLPNESIEQIKEDVDHFLKDLRFALNQPNEVELGNIIKEELGKEFNASDTKNVYSRLLESMLDWMKNKEGVFYTDIEAQQFFQNIKKEILGSIWFEVKEPVELFTGREQELVDLHKAITRSKETPTVISQRTSISGLGGIGKTELARKYAQNRGKEDYDNNVVWINAESATSLENSFLDLAKDNRVGIPTKDVDSNDKSIKDIVKEIYMFFRNRKSLFIFDNVEDPTKVDMFLPWSCLPPDANKPFILMTSRVQEWEQGVEVLKLNELKLEDAVELVKRGLEGLDLAENDQTIEELVKELQCFPLAIQQAIAYIREENRTMLLSIADYIEEYQNKAKELLNSELFRKLGNSYTQTTFTTWQISMDRIKSDKRFGELSFDILNIIAYFAADNINRDYFADLAGNDRTLRQSVRLLVKYSLVNDDKKSRQSVLNIHRLVQEVIRIKLEDEGLYEKGLDTGFGVLRKRYPFNDMTEDLKKKKELVPHLEAISSHVDKWLLKNPHEEFSIEKRFVLRLSKVLRDGYYSLGSTKKNKQMLDRHLPIFKKHYPENHFEIGHTTKYLGNVYSDAGDHQKAEEYLLEAIRIFQICFGLEGDLDVALTKVDLGNNYGFMGEYTKKKDLLESALRILIRHLGENHFIVATTLGNLGHVYERLGDPNKKRQYLEKALPVLEEHYGADHIIVGKTLLNLGGSLSNLGDYSGSIQMMERALLILEEFYGPDHVAIARVLADLGNAYGDAGNRGKKLELLERALQIDEQHYGPDHIEVGLTLQSLGNAYNVRGDIKKAYERLKRASEIIETYYEPDHVEVARVLGNLGDVYTEMSRYREAKLLIERALVIKKAHYKRDDVNVSTTLASLAKVCSFLGDYNRSKELLERALRADENHFGPDHIEVTRTRGNLGLIYYELGHYHLAKDVLEAALSAKEAFYGSSSDNVAITLQNLASTYDALGDYQKAGELFDRCLDITILLYGADSIFVANTMCKAFYTRLRLGHAQVAKIKDYSESLLESLEETRKSEHIDLIEPLEILGIAWVLLGNNAKGESFLLRALSIKEKEFGEEHVQLGKTLRYLGVAYTKQSEFNKANEVLENSRSILANHLGDNHIEVGRTLQELGNTAKASGNLEEAKILYERALPMLEQTLGEEHDDLAMVLANLRV